MDVSALMPRRHLRALTYAEADGRTSTVRVIDANDPGSVLADVAPGMHVLGASLTRLGTVATVVQSDAGAPVALTVAYGILARKRKFVPGEFVDLVDDDRVILSLDQDEFKLLRHVGE